MSEFKYWTRDEVAILELYYPKIGNKCCIYLPGRTKEAIKRKAAYEGIDRYETV